MVKKKRSLVEQQEKDTAMYQMIAAIAYRYGFILRTKEAIKKVQTVLGITLPKVPRTEDLEDKAAFILEKNRMIVHLYTGYNLEKKVFNKHGALQILITTPVKKGTYPTERCFLRQLKREDGAPLKVDVTLDYILNEISEECRPLTAKKQWANLVEIGQDIFCWVDEKGFVIRDFFENADKKSLVYKIQLQRLKYDWFVREVRGVTDRRRNRKILATVA